MFEHLKMRVQTLHFFGIPERTESFRADASCFPEPTPVLLWHGWRTDRSICDWMLIPQLRIQKMQTCHELIDSDRLRYQFGMSITGHSVIYCNLKLREFRSLARWLHQWLLPTEVGKWLCFWLESNFDFKSCLQVSDYLSMTTVNFDTVTPV
jgi:hypothetical protein